MSGPESEVETICEKIRISMRFCQIFYVDLESPSILLDCMYHILQPESLEISSYLREVSQAWQSVDFDLQMTTDKLLPQLPCMVLKRRQQSRW